MVHFHLADTDSDKLCGIGHHLHLTRERCHVVDQAGIKQVGEWDALLRRKGAALFKHARQVFQAADESGNGDVI